MSEEKMLVQCSAHKWVGKSPNDTIFEIKIEGVTLALEPFKDSLGVVITKLKKFTMDIEKINNATKV